jgi:hypothetical protein
VKAAVQPENAASVKRTVPSENGAPVKRTVPPENVAPGSQPDDRRQTPKWVDRTGRRRKALPTAPATPQSGGHRPMILRFARPLRHARFPRVGASQAISSIGDGVFTIALVGIIRNKHRAGDLGFVLAADSLAMLVMGPAVVLLPILLKSRGEFSAYGVMASVEALGSVIGGLVAAAWRPVRSGTAAVCALALLGSQLLALALGLPLHLLGVAVVATGFGYSVFGVLWMSALQQTIPDELLGRVLSVEMLGTFALAPFGLALAPLAIERLGERPVLVGAFVVLMVSTIVPLLQRDVRTFGGLETTEGPARP